MGWQIVQVWQKLSFDDKYDPKNKDKYFASALRYAFNDDKKTYKRIYDSIIKKCKKEYQFNKEKSKIALQIYGKPKLFQEYKSFNALQLKIENFEHV